MLLGAHESVAGGAHTAFARGDEDGCEAVQIFARPSAQWRAKPLTEEDVALFRRERGARGWPVFAHASYLINLCAADPLLLGKSRAALEDEMTRAEALGLEGVVIHPGAHLGRGEEVGVAGIAETISWLHERTRGFRVRLVLEITAGQGSCLGCRFEDMQQIFERTEGGDRLGLCFDTCHAFAAGYDLRTDEGYDEAFAALDRTVGLSALRAFHLNDAKTPLGSRVDRHQQIGEGHLGLLPFWRIVNDSRFAALPGMVETPPGPGEKTSFKRNVARLKALRGAPKPEPLKEPPAPAPKKERKTGPS